MGMSSWHLQMNRPSFTRPIVRRIHMKEATMSRTIAIYSAIVLLSGWNLLGNTQAHGFSNGIEPVVWNSNQKITGLG